MGSHEMFTWVASSATQETKKKIESNVARTCNRFSQFLKERRSFGDVGFGNNIIASPKHEMNKDKELFCVSRNNMDIDVENKSLDLFPLTISSSKNMSYSRDSPKCKGETKKATGSMTIIYDGKVLVFDDLQEEMAQQIMSLATTQTVMNTTAQSETSEGNNDDNTVTTRRTHVLSHFPIQRGASLHRFMEKRKHRIAASAPYQVSNSTLRKQVCKHQEEEQQLELKL